MSILGRHFGRKHLGRLFDTATPPLDRFTMTLEEAGKSESSEWLTDSEEELSLSCSGQSMDESEASASGSKTPHSLDIHSSLWETESGSLSPEQLSVQDFLGLNTNGDQQFDHFWGTPEAITLSTEFTKLMSRRGEDLGEGSESDIEHKLLDWMYLGGSDNAVDIRDAVQCGSNQAIDIKKGNDNEEDKSEWANEEFMKELAICGLYGFIIAAVTAYILHRVGANWQH